MSINSFIAAKQDQIVHLHEDSVCAWSIRTSNVRFGLVESIKSPLYCMKEFANVEWFFLFTKSDHSVFRDMSSEMSHRLPLNMVFYNLVFCINKSSKQKPLPIDFTFHLLKNGVCRKAEKYENVLASDKVKYHLFSFCLLKTLNDEVTVICKSVRNIKTKVEFLRSYEPLFLNGKLSDLELIVRGKRYKAHKVVLAANSPVFERMFSSEMRESIHNELEIEDIGPEVIYEFLRFLYTGKVSNWKKLAGRLFAVAHKYEIEDLQTKCELLLCKNLTVDNVIHVLVLSDLYDAEILKKMCLSLISKEFKTIIKERNYQDLQKTHPHLLMVILKNVTSGSEHEASDCEHECPQSDCYLLSNQTPYIWTIGSHEKVSKTLQFQMDKLLDVHWWFQIINVDDSLYLYLHMVTGTNRTINRLLKFNIIIQRPERFAVTIQVNLDKNPSPLQLIKLPRILTNLTILLIAELIPNSNFDDNLLKGYESFYRNISLSDVMICNNGKRYPAHKIILANRSKTFRKIILPEKSVLRSQNDFQEIVKNIEVEDVKSKVLKELLRYLYIGVVENLDSMASDLYAAANKFEIQDLKIICENALLRNLELKNVIPTVISSVKNNAECLRDECVLLIARNFKEMKEDRDFNNLGISHPQLVKEVLEVLHSGKRPKRIKSTVDLVMEEGVVQRSIQNLFYYIGEKIFSISEYCCGNQDRELYERIS